MKQILCLRVGIEIINKNRILHDFNVELSKFIFMYSENIFPFMSKILISHSAEEPLVQKSKGWIQIYREYPGGDECVA